MPQLLAVLKNDEEHCFKLVEQDNQPEETSKSFGEADSVWIANVTGIDCKYRQWTSFLSELDEMWSHLLDSKSNLKMNRKIFICEQKQGVAYSSTSQLHCFAY